jgi:hypothetical protein
MLAKPRQAWLSRPRKISAPYWGALKSARVKTPKTVRPQKFDAQIGATISARAFSMNLRWYFIERVNPRRQRDSGCHVRNGNSQQRTWHACC